MQLQHTVAHSGDTRFSRIEQLLVEAGFDLSLFQCEAEMQLAAREINRVTETELVKRFGATPAWIIGDSGPFIGYNGVKKLTRAFELGRQLAIDTTKWIEHLSANEVLDLLPHLKERARIQNFN
jgi:hypothetical protein